MTASIWDHEASLTHQVRELTQELARTRTELDARTKELRESVDYQTAASEVLSVISKSPDQLQPVLDSIVATAARLCRADEALIFKRVGDTCTIVAAHDTPAGTIEYLRRNPITIDRGWPAGRALLERRTVHVADVLSDADFDKTELQRISGQRSVIAVPLLKDGETIGTISLMRHVVAPFSEKEIDLVSTFASQAVIAVNNVDLFEEVQARTREVTEALEYQTATAEVLSVIARVPGELQPVLDTIVQTAYRLCNVDATGIFRIEAGKLHMAAACNYDPEYVKYAQESPPPIDDSSMMGRVVLSRTPVHIPDALADPGYGRSGAQKLGRWRTMLGVPLIHQGVVVGTLGLTRSWVEPFTPQQIVLVKTFADQAVIAIENARLFEAEQARTKELTEALEYQTATSAVLDVISRSQFDLEPVLQSVVETAVHLCRADHAMIYRLRDGAYRFAAGYGPFAPEYLEIERDERILPGPGTLVGRAAMTGTAVQIADALADPNYERKGDARVGNIRSMLGVPLMRDGEAIGVIGLVRNRVEPFAAREVELVATFANQAVIAINNVGLFEEVQARTKELQESLEYQTATSEVLAVISRLPNELQPVLDVVAQNAARVCMASDARVFRVDGNRLRPAAGVGAIPTLTDVLQHGLPMTRGSVTGRAVVDRKSVHVADLAAELDSEYPDVKTIQGALGHRTTLATPLLRDGVPLGAILIRRMEVKPFTDKQIRLLENFADQAVIAINNVGLFEQVQARTKELARSVEELRALGEVGRTVGSTLDLRTVLQTVLENACRMAFAGGGTIYVYSPATQEFHLEAGYNMSEEHTARVRAQPIRLGEPVVGECAARREAVQIEDLALADAPTPLLDVLRRAGVRSILAVPLIHQVEVVGALVVRRNHPGAFAAETLRLLEAFAAQSAIAIHNARLFKEVEQKGRELELASQHKSQFVANMSHELRTPLAAMLGYTELLADGAFGELPEKSVRIVDRVQINGRHLLGLINTVLDISKIEAGQFSLNLAEYSLTSLIETVRVGTESLANEKKLALVTEIMSRLPRGYGDEQRLAQVLLNLIGNAIKFTDRGEVRIAARAEEGQYLITVRDTGPGIPSEEQSRIFEEFHQVDNSSTRAKGGTGLGLAIAKKIVDMHGGSIRVESTPGQGSAFHVRLPIMTPRL